MAFEALPSLFIPNGGATMGMTSTYCSDCYNKSSKEDAQLQAAERAGKTPMTKQGACSKCGRSAVVIYYET
jgi:hypothetical protein